MAVYQHAASTVVKRAKEEALPCRTVIRSVISLVNQVFRRWKCVESTKKAALSR